MPALVKIPNERLTQLQEIANHFGGLSIPATIGQMIRELVKVGVIDCPSITGIEINVATDGLIIRLDNGEYIGFSAKAAQSLVDSLRLYATSDDKLSVLVNMDANFTIARKVRAVKVTIPALGKSSITKVLSPDLATDLADLIEAASRKIGS